MAGQKLPAVVSHQRESEHSARSRRGGGPAFANEENYALRGAEHADAEAELVRTGPVVAEPVVSRRSGDCSAAIAMAAGGAFARVGEASLALAVLAPLPTLLFATPFFWWAGRLWGPKVAAMLGGGHPSAQEWALRAGARLERFGGLAVALAPFLPVPSAFIYSAAGWTGMSLRRFMAFDLLGMVAWVGLIVGLGYAIGHPAVQVAKIISHYGLLATIAIVAIALAIPALRRRRAAVEIVTPTEQ